MFRNSIARSIVSLRLPGLGQALSRVARAVHTVPRLANQEQLQSNGIPGLYSAQGFELAWTKYQTFLLDKLSALTVDTDNETRIPFHILLNTAHKASEARVYNYASQAHNNHLFFEALTAPETNQTQPNAILKRRIETTFDNLDNLKSYFLEEAASLNGNGWVFLVEDANKHLQIVSCYNTGAPYTVHLNKAVDLNMKPVSENTAYSLSKLQEAVLAGEKNNHNIVLLALNVWEHAYLQDYSVKGKAEFLEKWWSSIDWEVVNSRLFSRS